LSKGYWIAVQTGIRDSAGTPPAHIDLMSPGDEAEAELGGYAAKGFTAAKMRVVGRDGFSISNCVRRVKAARRGLGPNVELMIDAHGSLEVATAIKLAEELEP
jgi:D-galactarolactone cycloisomerase